MSSNVSNPRAVIDEVRRHTRHALASVGLRLARSLRARLVPELAHGDELQAALAFADAYALDAGAAHAIEPLPSFHPLARLEAIDAAPAATAQLRDLLLLACIPEAHEAFAALCRLLHPSGVARPTVTLSLAWLESERADANAAFGLRDDIEDVLCHSPLARLGILKLDGDAPWHGQSLLPGPGVWEALMARAPRLDNAELTPGYASVPGLEAWLASPLPAQAVAALRRGLPCQVLVLGGDAATRATRVRALLGAAPATALRVDLERAGAAARGAAVGAAVLHQSCLWLESRREEPERDSALQDAKLELPLPVVVSARSEHEVPALGLPLLRLDVEPLSPRARRQVWQSLLPELGEHATVLAARYPIEPDDARAVVRDLELRQGLTSKSLALDEIGECIRARTPFSARPGVRRVAPRADFRSLLVPDAAEQQLQGAVRRVLQQITVLDDWGFAQGRAERRGVRMLFAGPPGTGKTLAAEVMAQALGVDLLAVDLSSLVSKWIGETEKNLAAVFHVAERARCLLLFDEADALFARRTETHDSHDRYANLETAYLLQRLECYESIAVLTTNLKANLDTAFARRFEFIVEFNEPDARAREALWRMHLPRTAPLAPDVDLNELAAWYAITGAQIKNAALAAAFLAASNGAQIHQRHFLLAIEREFDKAGRAHPGFPPHHRAPDGTPAQDPAATDRATNTTVC
jgi:hypothetical protein